MERLNFSMMDDDAKYTRDEVRKPHSNKHVTTACIACRKKRTKCDGRMPCSSCCNTQESCIYSHNDRRRQRRQRNTIKQAVGNLNMLPSSVKDSNNAASCNDEETGLGKAAGDGEYLDLDAQRSRQESKDNRITFTMNDDRPKLRSLAAAKTKSVDRSAIRPTMNDLQGKFDAKEGKLCPISDSGSFHAPPYRLRPMIMSTPYASEDSSNSNTEQNGQGCKRRPVQFVWQIERRAYAATGYTRTFGNLAFSSAVKVNGYSTDVQARQNLNFSAPEHLIFPLIDVDDSPLSRAFTDFRQLGRKLIAERTPHSQVADQGLIDVTLFFRERIATDPVNASAWAAEMLRAFRGTFSDHLLLACAICVGSLMRWFLLPTPDNYAKIPALARPTRLQRLKPHPCWVDLMIFPTFRDALVNSLRDWVEPCIKARWEFLWPYPLEDALIRHADSEKIFLAPNFAVHVDNPQNWLMQKSILETFPEVRVSEMNISV